MRTIIAVALLATQFSVNISAPPALAEPVLADPTNFRLEFLTGEATNAVYLASDASTNLYVGYHDPADPGGSNSIRKVTPDGTVSDFGAPIPDPDDVVVDINGDLTTNGSVLVGGVLPGGLRHLTAVSPDGLTTTQLFAVPNQPAYANVSSLAFDAQGRLLVVGGTNVLGGVTNDLTPFVVHTFGEGTNPVYVTTSPDGRIFTSFRITSTTYSINEVIDAGTITSDQPLVGGTGGFLAFSPTAFGDAAKPLFAQSATEVRRVDTNSGAVATFATGLEGVYPGLAFTSNGCLNILTGPGSKIWRVCECDPGTMDLAVTKTVSTNTIVTGDNLTYTITVHKYCALDATGVTVTDALPANVTLVDATPSQGSCTQIAGNVICGLGTLTNSQTATITINVVAGGAGIATNIVDVSANETEVTSENNTAKAITTVLPGGIDLTVDLAGTFGSCVPVKKKLGCPVDAELMLLNNGIPYGSASITLTNTCSTNSIPPKCKIKGVMIVNKLDLTGLPDHNLAIYLSHDTTLDPGDSPMYTVRLSKPLKLFLKGKPVKLSLKVPPGIDLTGQHLLVIVDAISKTGVDAVTETDETNNIDASPPIPALP